MLSGVAREGRKEKEGRREGKEPSPSTEHSGRAERDVCCSLRFCLCNLTPLHAGVPEWNTEVWAFDSVCLLVVLEPQFSLLNKFRARTMNCGLF